MKKIKTYLILLVIAGLFCISSCKKFIDPEINIDPNNPEDASMNVLLSGAEASLAFSYGSDLCRYPSLWIQTMSGLANQHLVFDNYSLTETDVNNMWYFNMYGGAMSDLSVIIKKAAASNSPYYGGAAKILMANALGVCTDLWGDVPYSQAFQGLANLKPKFDSQQAIYNSIQTLLDQGIVDMSASTSVLFPSTDDFLFSGSNTKWIRFAHSLKARYYLHLGKIDAANYTKALAEVSSGFKSNGDNAELKFGLNVTENNPIYQFFYVGRQGDAGVGSLLVELMKGTGTGLPPDPRMSVYFDDPFQIGAFDVTDTLTIDYRDPTAPSTNPYGTYVILPGDSMINYFGSIAGAGQSNVNNPGKAFANSDSPILFMTYAELKFIEAECSFRNGDAANAALAYNNAINASMDQHAQQLLLDGVSTTTFLDSVANETSSGITIEKIFTQKYIHMFCQGTEGFTDWRRSHDATHPDGIPTIYLAVEANTAQVPRRLPYPNSERLQNGINLSNAIANQGGASLTDRVWWDH